VCGKPGNGKGIINRYFMFNMLGTWQYLDNISDSKLQGPAFNFWSDLGANFSAHRSEPSNIMSNQH
jgi:hypothetical protein